MTHELNNRNDDNCRKHHLIITKIPLDELCATLEEMYSKGADYVDIAVEVHINPVDNSMEIKEDTMKIGFRKEYLSELARIEFEKEMNKKRIQNNNEDNDFILN